MSTIPMIGGPADGQRLDELPRGMFSDRPLSAIRWSGHLDGYAVDRPAVYLHTVAVRRDPHPCVRGLEMIAEWDAYVWDRVDPDSIKVTDQHALGAPHRFEVQRA